MPRGWWIPVVAVAFGVVTMLGANAILNPTPSSHVSSSRPTTTSESTTTSTDVVPTSEDTSTVADLPADRVGHDKAAKAKPEHTPATHPPHTAPPKPVRTTTTKAPKPPKVKKTTTTKPGPPTA